MKKYLEKLEQKTKLTRKLLKDGEIILKKNEKNEEKIILLSEIELENENLLRVTITHSSVIYQVIEQI